MLSTITLSVRAAELTRIEAVLALLTAAGLPTRDLTAASIENFVVATEAGELVGAVALEPYGDTGLLRSLVVAPNRRGLGVGTALVHAIEQRARDTSMTSVVLLTETAKLFFGALGYTAGLRAHAPAAVQASSEFVSVCPTSAVYMAKSLR